MSNLNLFDLSPRELTNSAVWTWLLDGLRKPSGTMRHSLATGLLAVLGVPVPDKVSQLRTEQPLPDGRRIDVYMEAEKKGEPFIFFIENKVQRDVGVDTQVKGYLDVLTDRKCPVYSAIFSLSPGIIEHINSSPCFTNKDRPVVFDPDRMIAFLGHYELHDESIPAEFLRHLVYRKEQANRVRAAITRGGADPEMWIAIARQNGVEDLFSLYVDLASELEFDTDGQIEVKYFRSRSVAVVARPNKPLLSLHPKKSNSNNGLWLGYNHSNWFRHFGREFPIEVLPEDFAGKPGNQQPNWHFGFFKKPEDLLKLFEFRALN